MKRVNLYRCHRLLALWLIASVMHPEQLSSQDDAYDPTAFSPYVDNSFESFTPDSQQTVADWPETSSAGLPENDQWSAFSTSDHYSDVEQETQFPSSSQRLEEGIAAPVDGSISARSKQFAFQPGATTKVDGEPLETTAPPEANAGEEKKKTIKYVTSRESSQSRPSQPSEAKTSTENPVSTPPEAASPKASEQLNGLAEFIAQTNRSNAAAPAPTTQPTTEPTPATPPLTSPPAAELKPVAPASPSLPAPQVNAEPPAPRPPTIITPTSPGPAGPASDPNQGAKSLKEISINFNNISMIEYIRFISRISNKNFVFDEETLQFNVTIVSEEPTTVENLMAALLQELKIRDLALLEQGNNIIIHRNPRVRSPARIVADGTAPVSSRESELVTRVFRLNTLDPVKASEIIRPLLSEDSLVEVLRDTNNLIITDLVATVNKIAQLIDTLDAPNSGVTIGQYVVRNAFVDSLVDLGTKILQPIAQGNPFVLVPHPVSNSIFIVSNSFIVEKALAILQNLDLNEGKTKILSLEGLQPYYEGAPPGRPGAPPPPPGRPPRGVPGVPGVPGGAPGAPPPGGVPYGPGGYAPGGYAPGGVAYPGAPGYIPGTVGLEGQYYPSEAGVPQAFPLGGIGVEGRPFAPPQIPPSEGYQFAPGGIGVEGRPSAIFEPRREFLPGGIGAATRWSRELPLGHIERTLFYIYKLRYRKGDQIEIALRKMANSLQLSGGTNADLIAAINSSQWIESSNALIFTGTSNALEKVRELILEVDVPLRQVFIEMLILNTSITDSLSYGVDWINRFGGGQTTGEQGFLGVAEPGFLIDNNNPVTPTVGNFPKIGDGAPPNIPSNIFNPGAPLSSSISALSQLGAYTAGVIGTHLTHNGTQFSTIGALVRAIHSNTKSNILLNPKIITEDNNTAEIFVGGTDRYKTQSITTEVGNLVTNNFQFIDVGTTLRVTPLIGNNGIITLDIIQETTGIAPGNNSGADGQSFNLIQVLNKTRSVTKIHVPNGFFVILSGMINDQETRDYSQIPCLGGIPIIGALCKRQDNGDIKSNLMLFIRPLIIDTDEDLEDITRRQQDIWNDKNKFRRSWNYELEEGLNFLNLKPTDPDEIGCQP